MKKELSEHELDKQLMPEFFKSSKVWGMFLVGAAVAFIDIGFAAKLVQTEIFSVFFIGISLLLIGSYMIVRYESDLY